MVLRRFTQNSRALSTNSRSDVFFEAANITNQILNFGLPAPIDVQVITQPPVIMRLRSKSSCRWSASPARPTHIHQPMNHPDQVNVDRKAGQVG